ncbi:hypothetical protein GCM10025872_15880 [Barrientosiimonas endolithica]|uniref:Uncharacterized protein n=1 Tax=Barrientosiimonas endolithica TaxID=1535208 RepID=A0ABN6YPD7_9MICO|nr:hypothetical protein GCM10025872_15880 [Barrientosiimonas endolithica]
MRREPLGQHLRHRLPQVAPQPDHGDPQVVPAAARFYHHRSHLDLAPTLAPAFIDSVNNNAEQREERA